MASLTGASGVLLSGDGPAPDRTVVAEAKEHGEVIITHDLDYGTILAFSGAASPSVVPLRVRDTRPASLLQRILDAWEEIHAPLQQGAIVAMEEAALRIRILPFSRPTRPD